MATILLVEDHPDLGLYEAKQIEQRGHRIIRCAGAPSIFRPCTMLRDGTCALASAADLIVFSCSMFSPLRGQGYRGDHLLHAYRMHPEFSRKPMLVVSVGRPEEPLPGTGPIEVVQKWDQPDAVVDAVERLLARADQKEARR